MSITVKEMIELNNKKRDLLTPENKEYYENMLVYIRSSFFRDERASEEVLLEMLDHMLEAQKDGKSAEDVFGKTPKELAEEITQSLPKDSFKNIFEFSLEIVLSLFGWFLVPIGVVIFFLKNKVLELPIISFLIYAFVIILIYMAIMLGVFKMLRKNTFENDKKREKRKVWIFGLGCGVVITAISILFQTIGPFGPKIEISSYTILGLGCFFLLGSYLFRKIREAK